MNRYPLIFSFRNMVAGKGFVAGVAIQGRVLLSKEENGFWMYGVQPGGIAAGGNDRGTAFCEFKNMYNSVLFDIAIASANYDEFKKEVTEFFTQVNIPNAEDWDEVLAEVRKTKASLNGLDRVDSDTKGPKLKIFEVENSQTTPEQNQIDLIEEAA